MSKVDSIKFRMYNTGSVGDCLLLLFMKEDTISFSMLIDCGGWLTTPAAISGCVKDIQKTCGGNLDLLVVTHQHMDHISGFNQAKDEFDKIHVKQVWMSWIEDESDDVAKILKDRFGKKIKELKGVANKALQKINLQKPYGTHVRGLGRRLEQKQLTIENTLSLIGFEEGIMNAAGKAVGRPTNDAAMNYVKGKGKKLDYLKPGKVISDMKGAEGIKFFILGPPRDEDMHFFKIDLEEDEMYHLRAAAASAEAEEPILEHIVDTGIILEDGKSPFDDQYYNASIKFSDEQEKKDYSWRGIETDWLESAAAIALRATRLTNNTSLAMALEFEDSGRVILLPGDAQSGNWMGWHKTDVMKELKKNGGKDTEDLLRDTIFYKVGHHGSHNGTASHSGLDFVKSKDLVAFMPLVQNKVPKEWGGAANFPAKKLYQVLIEKTRGRLVRTDIGLIADAKAETERKKLSVREKNAFNKALKKGANYFEFTIKG
jgi:beta-lactamase superfamily II metal-dependent hydrolase